MKGVRDNISRLYAFQFFCSFWLIAPILVPYFIANGLTATQVFVVQAIFHAAVLLLEIPSGYFSDVIGRKDTLVLSSVFLPIGVSVYALSRGFYGFVAAELIIAVAISLRSGTDSAFLYETLLDLKEESRYTRCEGTANFFQRFGDSIASVLGGLLATLTLRLSFYANVVTSLALLPIAVTLVEPERENPRSEQPLQEIVRIFVYCVTDREIRAIMLYSALLFSASITGIWSYYLYYAEVGVSIGFYGVFHALFGLWSGLGSKQAHWFEHKLGKGGSLYLPLLISPVFICLGFFKSVYLIPLIFLHAALWGVSGPILINQINRRVESGVRATVISVSKMFGSLSFIVLAPVFGKLIDVYSLSVAHVALGVFFMAVGALSVGLLRKHRVV